MVLPLPARAAEGVLAVDDKTDALDLSAARNPIAAQRAEISVQGPGEKSAATLRASGPGPIFNWSLFSFQNSTDHDLNLVIAVEPQRFAGSGLWALRPAGSTAIHAVLTGDGSALPLAHANGIDTINLHLAAKETANVALESRSPGLNARLWQAASFQQAQASASYVRGLVEGFALLMLLGICGLFIIRPSRAALAGVIFALAAWSFLGLDCGYLSSSLLASSGWAPIAQAASLSFLALALALCILVFLALVPHQSLFGAVLVAAMALALANMAYGLVEPLRAGLLARFGVALLTLTGFTSTWIMRRRNGAVVDRRLLFWCLMFCWVVAAALVALNPSQSETLSSALAAGLAVVLFGLALVLLRHSLRPGAENQASQTGADLPRLALSGGRHIVWDWRPAEQRLSLGPELAKWLELRDGGFDIHGRDIFAKLLHPLDLEAYQKLAERRSFKPGERLQLELRLREASGAYRWFELQASPVLGQGGSPDRAIGTLTDISNLKKAEERLTSDALQDSVTNLPNKALFLDRVERSLATLNVLPSRVILLDLDRFKVLNEGLGQDIGDRILKITAERLTNLVEADETVARFSGSQFALHCFETIERGDFSSFLESVEAAIAAPIKHGFQHVVLTASIGVSAPSSEGGKGQDLLDQATVAMLEARAEGGARISIFHTEMKDDRASLLALESDLRSALERNEIEIYYQPIVYLHSLDVVGFEALARWRHPEMGLLSPGEFLDVAEAAGMMKEIGQFMLAGAARQLGIWQRVHMRGQPFFVSVNVSATQLNPAELPAQVKAILSRENLTPGSLKIEITETVIMRQPERSAKLLQQLQAMGVGLACDDFGTGFSSLASLRDFPFDTLKIDRSFLNPDGVDERNAKIVSSITALAQSLHMAVVAEGLETQEQLDRVAELGCVLGQGYLIGMPETAEQAGARLLRMRVPHSVNVLPNVPPPSFSAQTPTPPRSLYEPVVKFTPKILPILPVLHEITGEVEELPSIFTLPQGRAKTAPAAKAKVKAKPTGAKSKKAPHKKGR